VRGAGSWRTTPAGAIRSGDWKLLEFFEYNRVELYNLREDLSETKDLAAAMPDKASELRNKLVAWRTELRAPMPTNNTEIGKPRPTTKKRRGNS
jgi:arylsulfatase A-like enzyme